MLLEISCSFGWLCPCCALGSAEEHSVLLRPSIEHNCTSGRLQLILTLLLTDIRALVTASETQVPGNA